MKIALLGYGKMGKIIAKMAMQRGHEIVYKSSASMQNGNFNEAEIAIEFSTPQAAVSNIEKCFKAQIPVVCGTTGWLDQKQVIEQTCLKNNGSFIYASNFSIGVHLFFNLNQYVAKLMKPWNEYQVAIEEIHHTEKKDAPSGTAITLAQELLPYTDKNTWGLNLSAPDTVLINARRESDVKGTHEVSYTSEIDTISIKHQAHSREGFALGALIAAEFIINKKGIFNMKDVLGM